LALGVSSKGRVRADKMVQKACVMSRVVREGSGGFSLEEEEDDEEEEEDEDSLYLPGAAAGGASFAIEHGQGAGTVESARSCPMRVPGTSGTNLPWNLLKLQA